MSVVRSAMTPTPFEIEERRLFADMLSILRAHSIAADSIPTLCMVGVQSHGKSSLVEFFVGIPLTLIKEDTGTRCPTKFFLQFDKEARTPICTIVSVPTEVRHLHPGMSVANPTHVNYKELPEALGQVMQQVEKYGQGGFSGDILEVHVVSSLCPNLFFIDLPGIVGEIDPRCGTIGAIVSRYLQMPNVIPIMVVKASEDLATGMLYTFIQRNALPGWKKSSLFIATHFDANLPKNGQSLTSKLEGHCVDPEDPTSRRVLTKYFVSLNPPPSVDRSALMTRAHSDLVDRIRRLEPLEAALIDQCLDEISRSHLPEFDRAYWRPYLGLANAKQAIKRKWYERYNSQFSMVRDAFKVKQTETLNRLTTLRGLSAKLGPTAIRDEVSDLSGKFLSQIKLVAEQTADCWGTAGGFTTSGMTFDEETAEYQENSGSVSWDPIQTQEKLSEIPGVTKHWSDELSARLLGGSQVHRMFNVNRALLATSPIPDASHERWMNALGHVINSSSDPSWDHAVAQIANWWLSQLLVPSITYLCSRIRFIYGRLGKIVVENMKVQTNEQFHHFIDQIQDAYDTFLSSRMAGVVSTSIHLLQAKTSFLNMGLPQSVALLAFDDPSSRRYSADHQQYEEDEEDRYRSRGQSNYSEYLEDDNDKRGSPSRDQRNSLDEISVGKCLDLTTRVRVLLGESSSNVSWPNSRELTKPVFAVLRQVAERVVMAQMTFSMHDIESLLVCDVERPVHNPTLSCDNLELKSLAQTVNKVVCQDAAELLANISFDADANERDVKECDIYLAALNRDLVEIELKRDQLKSLYDGLPTSILQTSTQATQRR